MTTQRPAPLPLRLSKLQSEAERQAAQLKAFWMERGYLKAEFTVKPVRGHNRSHPIIYEIASNLTDGMPPGPRIQSIKL